MNFSLLDPKIDLKNFPTPFIGVDEVGRGCLAGPVAAAAVIFKSEIDTEKYKDSKLLKEEEREELALSIQQHHLVCVGWASVEEIDKINILQASFLAMRRAIAGLQITAGSVLVDGRDIIPNLESFKQQAIIQGDKKVSLISAASIAAKVARDHLMKEIAQDFNAYGFEKHKGYGTPYHRQKIQEMGPCKWHRQSFGGVKEFIVR
ncbi:ribonuclease HII [Pseudobdellovibrio exovorus]|uniref:ribonuclease HII n=1 Tax=Pseudobdellovibrio exovorus TaxID=453816 RepID=UPI00034DC761|nr:ribonuclease HII [Pseudobdellovibrio exovorus]